ncbi:nuclear transport factor 2 family protein [Kribbella sp. CA-253562]|uniref:nuclear transport factor 2 family protein n=1 Tax=Kribbella sp. CA-253562 TaxID=3239942 RepID=UPI003D8ACE12
MTDERAIQHLLARYVRATDARDGSAQGALFTDDAVVQILVKSDTGEHLPAGEPLIGGSGVRWAVDNLMPALPPGFSSHHLTADHLIEVTGDRGHLNAQFVVFLTSADGTIRPVESGYYDTDLHRLEDGWRITRHDVLMDRPPHQPA